jgi:hypothetical protein
MSVDIVPIREDLIEGFHAALDTWRLPRPDGDGSPV